MSDFKELKETTSKPENLKIYNEELRDFLPDKILDFHIHVFPKGTIPENVKPDSAGVMVTDVYEMEQLKNDLKELLPGKETYGVCFGTIGKTYNRELNNNYISDNCDKKRFFPLRLISPKDDPDKVAEEIKAGKFMGFKPYRDYVDWIPYEEVKISDMLPDSLLNVADKFGLIIVLHIPRKDRLADPFNQEEIVRIAKKNKNIKLIIAHIGRAYFLKNVIGYLDDFKKLDNIYFDLAMVNNWEVIEYLFKNIPVNRVIFGTDLPISAVGGRSVEINDQYAYVTKFPTPWSIADHRNKIVFTSFFYEGIRAIKKAAQKLKLKEREIEGVFYKNGMSLLK